jgi:hypothetical protein
MKKKTIAFVLSLSLLLVTACGTTTPTTTSRAKISSTDSVAASSTASSESKSSSASPEDQKLLNGISVTYDEDTLTDENGKQRMIIRFENKTDKIFSGDISATFYGSSDILGWDVFTVKDFKPGENGNGNVYITPSDKKRFAYDITNYKFSEDKASSGGKIDKSKSDELSKYMYESFGGSGDKELSADWYWYIKKIEVFTDGETSYAVTTISTEDEADAKSIGNAILSNANEQGFEIAEIVVKDQSGKELFRRARQ